MSILDSGARRQFGEDGPVRDIQEGKGRCDLLPLVEIDEFIKAYQTYQDDFLTLVHEKKYIDAAAEFAREEYPDPYTAVIELSKHFEEGAKKYEEDNWRKGSGIPLRCFEDSAVRHWLKHQRGDTDESHNRAVLWNLICAEWTRRNLNAAD